MRYLSNWKLVFCLLFVVMAGPMFASQTPAPAAETATQFYVKYLEAFKKATTIEELLPLMSAERRKMIEGTPEAERPKMFSVVKMMAGMLTDVKVLKEDRSGDNATLTAEAVTEDKGKATGTIEIVREAGTWKLSKESWKQ